MLKLENSELSTHIGNLIYSHIKGLESKELFFHINGITLSLKWNNEWLIGHSIVSPITFQNTWTQLRRFLEVKFNNYGEVVHENKSKKTDGKRIV